MIANYTVNAANQMYQVVAEGAHADTESLLRALQLGSEALTRLAGDAVFFQKVRSPIHHRLERLDVREGLPEQDFRQAPMDLQMFLTMLQEMMVQLGMDEELTEELIYEVPTVIRDIQKGLTDIEGVQLMLVHLRDKCRELERNLGQIQNDTRLRVRARSSLRWLTYALGGALIIEIGSSLRLGDDESSTQIGGAVAATIGSGFILTAEFAIGG